MLVTVFLVVLIAALVFGNILLSLLKPHFPSQPMLAQEPPAEEKPQGVFKPNPVFEQAAERERISMLNRRIGRLEGTLLKINGSKFLGKKLNGTVLGQKLSSIEEFKDSTRLEIEALKQELAGVKKHVGIREKKNPGADYPISDEKLHEMVFRRRAAKG